MTSLSFHTRTISNILSPVEQQVAQLILAYNDIKSVNHFPNLPVHVQAVTNAVKELVKVGYETVKTSDDQTFNDDMPNCLESIKNASKNLQEAFEILGQNPISSDGRKVLIESSRGILQGTFAVLLTLDSSDVRRITNVCESVLCVLATVDRIENFNELREFIQTLTPCISQMVKNIVERQDELIIDCIVEALKRGVEDVKRLIPILISALKLWVTSLQQGLLGDTANIVLNRDYLIVQISHEIQELIRNLRLTRPSDLFNSEDSQMSLSVAKSLFNQRYQDSKHWLSKLSSLPTSVGESNLMRTFDIAQHIARLPELEPSQTERILKSTGEFQQSTKRLLNAISTRSPHISDSLHDTVLKLERLNEDCIHAGEKEDIKLKEIQPVAINMSIKNNNNFDFKQRSKNLTDKYNLAQKWLSDPCGPHKDLGMETCLGFVQEAQNLIQLQIKNGLRNSELEDLFDSCLESCDHLNRSAYKISEYSQKHLTPEVIQEQTSLTLAMERSLNSVWRALQESLILQVADSFTDLHGPLRAVSEAALPSPENLFPLDMNFYNSKAHVLNKHVDRICATGQLAASLTPDSFNGDALRQLSGPMPRLSELINRTGQMLVQSRMHPDSQASAQFHALVDHFEALKVHWMESAENMRTLVDDSIDAKAFIQAQENGMLKDTHKTEEQIQKCDTGGVVESTTSIARRANRVIQIARREADNSEDPQYSNRMSDSVRILCQKITPMVTDAKSLVTDIRKPEMRSQWTRSNKELLNAVDSVRESVGPSKLTFAFPRILADDPLNNAKETALMNSEFKQLYIQPEYQMSSLSKPREDHSRIPQRSNAHRKPNSYVQVYITPCKNSKDSRADVHTSVHNGAISPDATDTEDDFDFPLPASDQPILAAAHAIHAEAKQWSARGNELIATMQRLAVLMGQLSQYVRSENGGNASDLIHVSQNISDTAKEFCRLAKEISHACTDKRLKNNLEGLSDRVSTIGCQLRILSTVKATMLGAQDDYTFDHLSGFVDSDAMEEQSNTETLVNNAQNLMQTVIDTVKVAEAASIKMRIDSGVKIRWQPRIDRVNYRQKLQQQNQTYQNIYS